MRSVVITGTSTGIGWGTAKVLIANGFRVFGSVRKTSDAERLAAEFGARFVPLIFDVTDEAAVKAAAADVRTALAGEKLAGLVNNAGVAVAGPLLELPIEEFRRQIEINLVGVVITTKAFAPLVGTDPQLQGNPGRIINISSVGGRNAVPFLAPYAASKFALEGLSESLRRELLPFGIDVIIIGPGAVATPIWSKAEQIDVTPYLNTPYATPLERLRA
jgi:NAD(P)-dependent dehydrogenase (short-subunit alcohol dehydrogenase family)